VLKRTCGLVFCLVVLLAGGTRAQSLRHKIETIFDETLRLQLAGSPGAHGQHFSPDNVATSDQIITALTSFLGANIASFPLSSTGATVAFDLSTGVPVRRTESLGPIFSEAATTLGKKRVILGYNFTYMSFERVRGLNLEDLRFTFTHEDVGAPGLGDSDNEFDTIDLFMDMQLDASILAFYMTAGVTDRLDVGLALPLVNVHVVSNPEAIINSFTFVANDSANHFYGGTTTEPILTTTPTPVNDDATGIGDVAVRAKLNFYRGKGDLAALVEARVPTGDEENFLGTGYTTVKGALIGSRSWGSFSPHVNLAYVFKDTDLDRDEVEAFFGYEQGFGGQFTLVLDFLGRFQVGDPIDELQFAETVTISRPVGNTALVKTVESTNVPSSDRDNTMDLSLGGKYAPREFLILLGNVIVPLNDGGLRPDIVSTIGFEFNF
jgi:hypothetical protein